MSERTRWVLTLALWGCADSPTESSKEQHFSVGIHEDVTEHALGFLRDDVLDDIADEHGGFADSIATEYQWVHSDGCAFGETVQQVNAFYADSVKNLVP